MSIYYPQYKEQILDAMPNCMCGENGRSRNDRECVRRGGCRGCGFDRDEYMRRLALLRDVGIKHISSAHRADLVRDWGVNPTFEIFSLRVGKKKTKKEGTG